MIPEEFRASHIGQPLRTGLRAMMRAWDSDEFVLDPSRITLSIGRTGYSGDDFKRDQLMDRHGVQINKTTQHGVVHDQHRHHPQFGGVPGGGPGHHRQRTRRALVRDEPFGAVTVREEVQRLTASTAPLPDFSGFHPVSRTTRLHRDPEGDVRRAFYLSYDDANCESTCSARRSRRS